MEKDEQSGMDPGDIGKKIARIVGKKNPPAVYVAGAQYRFRSLLCRILPTAVRQRIVGNLYG